MSNKPMFIVLTGPSGSGKSTAIAGIMQKIRSDLEVVVPVRVTTRPPRVSDNPVEVSSIKAEWFRQGVLDGNIIIPHQIRDKWNGLVMPEDAKKYGAGKVYMQALPTSAGVILKEEYADKFNVIVCRLKARKQIVLTRLSQRGPKDDAPADEAARRAAVTPAGNDWELDAERSAAEVRDSLLNLIYSCCNLPEQYWFQTISNFADFSTVSTDTMPSKNQPGLVFEQQRGAQNAANPIAEHY